MPPWGIRTSVPVLLGFIVLLGFVVGSLFLEVPVAYELKCDRSKGGCTFTEQRLGRSRAAEARIASLQHAEVRRGTPGWANPLSIVWVVSRKSGGERFAAYWSRAEAEEAARKINAFLRDPTAGRVVLAKSVPLTYWIAGALIPLIATLLVVLASAALREKAKPRH
jgi:hypothetical protein